MIPLEKPNPFSVLRLPLDAPNRAIVEEGKEKTDFAETAEERLVYRSAIEELITHSSTRVEYELFEIPDTRYEDPELQRFITSNRRNPVELNKLGVGTAPPELQDFNMEALIGLFLEGLQTVPAPDPKGAVEGQPFQAGNGRPPLEVRDVLFG